jgi:prepilin-type N-terminal cleavage/methylation domain-containing protein
MKHNHGWRSAFTLIEMLTVTAIIAMLATALVSGLKSAQRQAHTALCQARMKNLHQACMNYLSDTGYYPYAGSYEWLDRSYQTYQERKGWVTWIRKDGKDTNPWAENNKVAHAKEYLYVGWDGENALRSGKEGSIFKYASRDTSAYFCKEFNEGKGDVRRSYAMNDWFGSRRNKLWRPRQLRNFQNDGIEPSRMGYIIELQSTETGVTQGDYDNSKPIAYDSVWEPDPNMKKERYGIWHRKSGDLHGHVIFVDGHIESLTATTNPQGDDYQTQNTKIRTGKH